MAGLYIPLYQSIISPAELVIFRVHINIFVSPDRLLHWLETNGGEIHLDDNSGAIEKRLYPWRRIWPRASFHYVNMTA